MTTARFSQLTYTNYDGGTANGWQVKEASGLDPNELDLVRSGIDPQLDPGYELPRFPSPDDLARFPYRLVFTRTTFRPDAVVGDRAVWWHHAPAGADGAGRAGNVFIHVLLDREPAAPADERASARPIDWWRSRDWLVPYGQAAVRGSELAMPPRPGEHVSAAGVIDFLLDPEIDRFGVLTLLLDACSAALAGGPPVVLATRDTDRAALWIGAVTHLTSTAVAHTLAFSTLERSSSLDSRLRQGALVCCVPLTDLPEVAQSRDRRYVVINEDELANTGDLDGSPHLTEAGDRVAVTEWSSLARVTLVDQAHAAYALDWLDRLDLPHTAHPGWPLAMVVALDPDTFADGSDEAVRLLVRSTPAALPQSELAAARDLVLQQTTGEYASAEKAWRMLSPVTQPGQSPSPLAETVMHHYVALALADRAWLTQPGGPPVPAAPWVSGLTDDSMRQMVINGIEQLHELAPTDDRTAVALLGMSGLLIGLGLLDRMVIERLQDLAAKLLGERLRDRPAELIDEVGPAPESILRAVIRPAIRPLLREWRRPLGSQLPWIALEWLYPDRPAPLVPHRSESDDDLELCIEFAFQRAMADPRTYAEDRVLAVSAALENELDPEILRPMVTDPPMTLTQLYAIERDSSYGWHTERLPWEYFGPVLASADSAYPLPELCRLLTQRRSTLPPPAHGALDLARMRELAVRDWWKDTAEISANIRVILRGGIALQNLPDVRPAPEVLHALQAAMVLECVVGVGTEEVEQLIRRRTVPGGVVAETVRSMVLEGLGGVPIGQVAVTAMLGEPHFPEAELASPRVCWAHTIQVVADDEPQPILRYAVTIAGQRGGFSLATMLGDVKARLRQLAATTENRERVARSCEKFAPTWLRPLFPGESLLSKLRGAP